MTHRLELERPTDGATRTLREDDLNRVVFTREHTALSGWRAEVPLNYGLEEWALAEANLYYEDTHLFRGYLTGVQSRERRASTRLLGQGIERDLKDGSAVVSYSNIEAWKAVRDYWNNQVSGVSATVHKPSRARMGDITQAADTDSEFADILSVVDTDPVEIRNGAVETLPTAAWSYSGDIPAGSLVNDAGAEQAEAREVSVPSEGGSNTVSTEYDIPEEHARGAVRYRVPDGATPRVEFRVDGEVFHETTLNASGPSSYEWFHGDIPLSGDLLAGQHDVNVNVSGEAANGERLLVDVAIVYDDRYDYTFPSSTDSNDLLAGPETHADEFQVRPEVVHAPARVTEISLTVTANDTTGEFAIATSLDGSSWTESANVTSTTDGYASSIRETAYGRVSLSRYGSRTTASPTQGFNGQILDDYSLTVSGDEPTKIGDKQIEGSHMRNQQRLHELAGMRFVVGHDPDEITVESFAPGDVTRTAEWVVENKTRKLDARDYANSVTVRGAYDSNAGERFKSTEDNQAEINLRGLWHYDETDTSLETQADVDSRAIEVLNERLRELDLTGFVNVVPIGIAPGFAYPVEWTPGDATDTPLERVNYTDSSGSLTGRLEFDPGDALELELADQRAGLRRTNERL